MGGIKRQWEQENELRKMAEEILIELGIVACCEMHEDFRYHESRIDESRIYAMATEELKKKYPTQKDYKAFHQQIHHILQETPATSADACPYCQKLWDE